MADNPTDRASGAERSLFGFLASGLDAVLSFAGIKLAAGTPATKEKDVQASAAPTAGKGIDTAKNLLGFLIAGFGAILSFIGIKSGELASILRNEEPFVGIVALAFLLSIMAAILSIFKGGSNRTNPGCLTNRRAVASLLFIFALVTFLPAVIHIPFVTSSSQEWQSASIGGLLIIVSLALMSPAHLILSLSSSKHENSEPKEHNSADLKPWSEKPFDLQLYLVLASVMFLAIAGYAALRLESASQASPFAQLGGKVTVVSKTSAVLSLTITSAKVPAPDRVDIDVTALPRATKIKRLCTGVKRPPDSFPCAADPCSYKPSACDSLVGWTLPPNATGGVQENLTLSFSPSAYQRLHVEDQLCERASAAQLCATIPPGGTHLDVEVPAPPA